MLPVSYYLSFVCKNEGLSLIEAMVATVITAVGFLGVFSLVVVTEKSMSESIARQKMQIQANQIIEVIDSDIANIDNYAMSLENCVAPTTADAWQVRGYEWCQRLTSEAGAPRANDTRAITITTLADDSKVIHILLESHNGEVQVVLKRSFND